MLWLLRHTPPPLLPLMLPLMMQLLLLLAGGLPGASASRMLDIVGASIENMSCGALGLAGGPQRTPWDSMLSGRDTLGQGGFGKVARQYPKLPCLGSVAVKEVGCCGKSSCARNFFNEINAMKILRHPNVIELYDYFPYDKTKFCKTSRPQFVMEDIDGGDLHRAFRKIFEKHEEPFNLLRAKLFKSRMSQRHDFKQRLLLMALVDTLRGLDHIHQMGYVHRDLKPHNIWAISKDEGCVESMSCRFVLGDLGLVAIANEYSVTEYRIIPSEGFAALPVLEKPDSKVTVSEVRSGESFRFNLRLLDKATNITWLHLPDFGGGWIPTATEQGAPTVEPAKYARYTSKIAGTPTYLPPEAVQGKATFGGRFLSGKSDVWALGVSLHEAYLWGSESTSPRWSTKLRRAMQDKTYLPEKLRSLLFNMTAELFIDRPSARAALSIAEEVMQQEYSMTLPERVPKRVACIDACRDVRREAIPREVTCGLSDVGEVKQTGILTRRARKTKDE